MLKDKIKKNQLKKTQKDSKVNLCKPLKLMTMVMRS
jgi:hypothetical protein